MSWLGDNTPDWLKNLNTIADPSQNLKPKDALDNMSKFQGSIPGATPDAPTTTDKAYQVLAPAGFDYSVNGGGNPIEVGEHNDSWKPPNPYGTSFDVNELVNHLKEARKKSLVEGSDFASKYFGAGNKDMAEVLDTRRKRAMGLNSDEVLALRERGNQGINQQMATSMRALRGLTASSGVRGGATVGMAVPIVNNANNARGNLERDIGIADMERRGTELNNYERSLTGERSGELGTIFGYAGLDSADRNSAMQYGLGKDFVDFYRDAASKQPNLDGDKPWSWTQGFTDWRKTGFDPRESPWNKWMHENVFDPKDYGFDSSEISPNRYWEGKI